VFVANGIELPIGSKNAYPCNENTNNQENKCGIENINMVEMLTTKGQKKKKKENNLSSTKGR